MTILPVASQPARIMLAPVRIGGQTRDAAPHVDARIKRRALVRMKTLADRPSAGRRRRRARPRAASGRRSPARVSSKCATTPCASCSKPMHVQPVSARGRRRAAGDRRIEQHALQIAAMDRVLRIVVAGVAAERLAVDQLAEAVEERGLARQHRHARQLGLEAQPRELARRVRQDVDADAERPHLGRGFEHARGDADSAAGRARASVRRCLRR